MGIIMKRVGIVTWYKTANYGSCLQAIALSKTLDKLGYEGYFLRGFKLLSFMFRHPRMLYARLYKKIANRTNNRYFTPVPYQISNARQRRIEQYAIENCRELKINTYNEWKKIIEEKMIFIAGSDLIWNPALGYPGYFFLDFAYYANLPCMAYASSVGSQNLPKKYYTAYRLYLNAFKSIGVRETATKELFSKIINKPITKVNDPTLLLSIEEWDELANKAQYSEQIPEKYILCYFVMNDPRYWVYAKIVQKSIGDDVVVLPMHNLDEEQPYIVIKDGTAYEFLDLIRNAELILTDSFHACSLSLQYKKEFYLMKRTRKAEDAKFDELLNRYGLKDRVIINEDQFVRNDEIDYEIIHRQLEEDRNESIKFLESALVKCEQS